MYFHYLFTLLFLAHSCTAGPLVILIATIADVITEAATVVAGDAVGAAYAGELAAEGVYSSVLGQTFGMTASGIMFGDYVVVNGALFYGSSIEAGAAIVAAGGGK